MKFSVAVAVVAAIVASASASQLHLDAFTDQSSAARELRVGRMYQTFTPSFSSRLVQIDVLIGAKEKCVSFTGELRIHRGEPNMLDLDENTILLQNITTACRKVSCFDGKCVSWESFPLSKPLLAKKGQAMAFSLNGMRTSLANAWVGVSPFSNNFGGPSSLVTSSKFKTKYSHWTFRTWMDSAKPAEGLTNLDQDDASKSPITNLETDNNEPSATSTSSSDSQKSNTVIVVVSAILGVVVALTLLVVVAVRARRKLRQGKLSINPSGKPRTNSKYDMHQELYKPTAGGRKRPVYVLADVENEASPYWADPLYSINTPDALRPSTTQAVLDVSVDTPASYLEWDLQDDKSPSPVMVLPNALVTTHPQSASQNDDVNEEEESFAGLEMDHTHQQQLGTRSLKLDLSWDENDADILV
eukprot:m.264066 g.264066  ORF g.264066 m.264066 type:complete len:415 (+) comp27452_c0_seq1:91-1335(+)